MPVLPPDTTPTAIRDALIDEERADFEHACQEAIAETARTLDLTRVLDVLRTASGSQEPGRLGDPERGIGPQRRAVLGHRQVKRGVW